MHADDDRLVQPILVTLTGTHVETIHAAAAASCSMWLDFAAGGDPTRVDVWARWLSGAFTKTVRRVKQLPAPYVLDGAHTRTAVSGKAAAMAFDPMLPESFARPVRRAQVQGTQARLSGAEWPAAGTKHATAMVQVLVRGSLRMSTGKAAAQAAHAAMGAVLAARGRGVRLADLADAVEHMHVRLIDDDQAFYAQVVSGAGWTLIKDAGRTEVDPDTLTSAARIRTCDGGDPVSETDKRAVPEPDETPEPPERAWELEELRRLSSPSRRGQDWMHHPDEAFW